MDELQAIKPRYRNLWLGLLAGIAALAIGSALHNILALMQPAPTKAEWLNDAGSASWLMLQGLDFADGMVAGMVAAHWSPRRSWRAMLILLGMMLVYRLFATLPMTRSLLWMAVWYLVAPLGVVLGAGACRHRERTRPDGPRRPHAADHAHVPATPLGEAALVVALCFGYPILTSTLTIFSGTGYGTFSDNNLLALVLFELMLGASALVVLHARHYPLQTLLPRPSFGGVGVAFVLYLLSAASSVTITALSPDHLVQPVQELVAGHRSLVAIALLSLVNGTYEEVFLLAYLQRGLRRLGPSNAIGVTLLVRLLYHTYQGPVGFACIGVFGLLLGVWYWRSGSLFPAIAAHVAADFAALL